MTVDLKQSFGLGLLMLICFTSGGIIVPMATNSPRSPLTMNTSAGEYVVKSQDCSIAGRSGGPAADDIAGQNRKPTEAGVCPACTPAHKSLLVGLGLAEQRGAYYEITAYCPNSCCCGAFADGVTASGHVIQPGDKFCAADPSIPFGTMLDIPGYGIVPVLDRGGAIKGARIDIFCSSHSEAKEWGRQKLLVTKPED